VFFEDLEREMVARGSKEMIKKDGTSTIKATTDAVRKSLKHKGKINSNQAYVWIINT
jgi:hypothetical protein